MHLRICLYRNIATTDNNDNVVKSPRLAAIGVAMLSGFTLHFLDRIITATIIEPKTEKACQKIIMGHTQSFT